MSTHDAHTPGAKKQLGGIKRRALNTTQEALIKTSALTPDQTLPLVVEPALEGVDLIEWATSHRDWLTQQIHTHGGILFRGFAIDRPEQLERFVTAASGELLEYRERSSPRSQVVGNIYTSTDHPPDQTIFLHNENSYQTTWPLQIFFCCTIPAQTGGETPIADVRKVYQRIDPAIRQRFADKQVMYVRNFGGGVGLSWQTVFQTSDRAAVDEYCRHAGITTEWREGDRLRTRRVGPAIGQHPVTGEQVWFNHATFFHVTTLEPQIQAALLAQFQPEELPNNTYYGDGTPIEDEVMAALRAAYEQETVIFPWQRGDVLMLDNMLVAHGRSPFTGSRQVLVGMAHPTTHQRSSAEL
ncbi:MAG TPA: TauD/TfdA family dioxygenase [Herpetosiphonaceae bacterium]